MNNNCYIDLETNGFLYGVNTIHCAVAYIEQEQMYFVFTSDPLCSDCKDINEWLSVIKNYNLVGHNIIQYDLPVLHKLAGYQYNPVAVDDTLVMSRLFYPDREGHSLEYWGNRFGYPKGDHSDFSAFSQEMLAYCKRDVDITRKLYLHLTEEEKDWDWAEAYAMTKEFFDIMGRQADYGVLFNKDDAESFSQELDKEIESIETKLMLELPKKVSQIGVPVLKPFKKDGTYTEAVKKWIQG